MGKERKKEREWNDLPKESWLGLRVFQNCQKLWESYTFLSWEETQGKVTVQ